MHGIHVKRYNVGMAAMPTYLTNCCTTVQDHAISTFSLIFLLCTVMMTIA